MAPSPESVEHNELTRFRRFLGEPHETESYLDLWRWSVTNPGSFWEALADFEQVDMGGVATGPTAPDHMPGGEWFPGRTVNYAQHLLSRAPEEALLVIDDDNIGHTVTRDELIREVANLASTLRSMGVCAGDRVAAVLSNRAEAVVGLLASAAVGAVWAICSPEFGASAIVSRLEQLKPKVLLGMDGYSYGGRIRDSRDDFVAVAAALPLLNR